jgi:hypothetical protein
MARAADHPETVVELLDIVGADDATAIAAKPVRDDPKNFAALKRRGVHDTKHLSILFAGLVQGWCDIKGAAP